MLALMPNLYRCSFQKPGDGLTPYKLVTGPGTAFDNGVPAISHAELADGSSNTIAIVEDHSKMVPWTKPEDLTIDQALKVLNDPVPHRNLHARTHAFSYELPTVNLAFLDGSMRLYMPRESLPVRRSMFTHAGGEVDNWRAMLDDGGHEHFQRLRIDRFVVLFLYPLLAFLPAIIAYFQKPQSIEPDSA